MTFRLGVMAILLAGLFSGASFAADPSGTWRWEHEDLAGSGAMVPDILKLTLDGGKVSGVYVSPDGELPIENASLDGDTLHWELNIDAQGQMLNIAWTGEISGDDVTGTVKFGDFGESPWAAKRDGAVDPSGTWRWEHEDGVTGQTIKDVLTVKYDGEKVSGTYLGPGTEIPIENATLDGDTLHWELNVEGQGQPLNIAWTGAISGNDITGTVKLGDLGEFPWAAKRDSAVSAVDPSGTWRWDSQDPSGETVKNILTLKLAEGKVVGSVDVDGTKYEVNNARVAGNTLSWDFEFDAQGQVLNIRLSGEISGDTVTGDVSLGDFGDFPWEAKRD